MKTLIFTNGDYGDYSFCRNIDAYDDIICADNGMRHARFLGVTPQLIVGDFDSTPEEDLAFYKSKGILIETFSSVKDSTDTEIAIDRAIKRGGTQIDIFGGIGTRLDHTLANVHLLYMALKQGVTATLVNEHNTVFLIKEAIEIKGQKGDVVSLLPFTGSVTGIYTTHLGYPLINGTLTADKPLGVSNYMLEEKATISIKEGLLLVIKAKD